MIVPRRSTVPHQLHGLLTGRTGVQEQQHLEKDGWLEKLCVKYWTQIKGTQLFGKNIEICGVAMYLMHLKCVFICTSSANMYLFSSRNGHFSNQTRHLPKFLKINRTYSHSKTKCPLFRFNETFARMLKQSVVKRRSAFVFGIGFFKNFD